MASNVFANNDELDVLNGSESPVYVGGNWWGGVEGVRDAALAEVSGNVYLEGSAWKGTVAIGTEADVAQEILGRILQYALTEAGFRARTVFNSPGSILRRAFDLKTNMRTLYRLSTYLTYAPLFRREMYKKHGLRFGLQ